MSRNAKESKLGIRLMKLELKYRLARAKELTAAIARAEKKR